MSITSQHLLTSGPLVFQCRSCKTILSDSSEFVCTLEAPDGARFVCLRGVTDARVDHIATTTSAPHSVHFAVCCEACGAAVGRLYTQGPLAMAAAINLLCLEVSRCLSYELGSAEVRAQSGQRQGHSTPAAAAAAAQMQQQHAGDGAADGGCLRQQQTAAAEAAAGGAAAGAAASAGVDPRLVLELLARVEHLEATVCTLQGMQVLHDAQLRELPGYQAHAATLGGS